MGSTLHIEDRAEWDIVLEKNQVVVVDCKNALRSRFGRREGNI